MKKMKILCWKSWLKILIFGLGLFLISEPSYASSVGNLPFNTSMDEFKAAFIEVVFSISIILMMGSCVMMAFGEWGDGIKRLINMVFFLALALAAPTGVVLLFGTGAVC
jgi:hypothetical protein